MPEGDKGGVIGIAPIKTHAITAYQQLMRTIIKTDPPILTHAKRLSFATRRKR